MWESLRKDRGQPWDHDPGPDPDGGWAQLFAATPHYRRISAELLGDEAFRWHFGPMFYRGRLGDGQAKVLVVGQEGAQDESLAHRSFVGGTGARLQHLLRHLGVRRSYLFLNTFVYPIFGEYDEDLEPFVEDPANPIVRHRHELFQRAAAVNDLALVISVGNAARDAVDTWVRMRGGELPTGTRHVHVLHPGAAAAGSGEAVQDSFRKAVDRVARWVREDPGWLPADPGGDDRFDQPFRYASAPVPFADLPFGVPWRLGRGATSSNRRDRQAAIQLFSADGRYDNDGHKLRYTGRADGSREGYEAEDGDLPYEPPKVGFGQFDRGPGQEWARLLMGGEPGLDWPDFAALGLSGHPSFGFGPILRGRVDDASIAVLADQESHDDLFTGRALTGAGGQRLQALLTDAGLSRRYCILRVLPVDGRGTPAGALERCVDHPQVRKVYAAFLARLDGPRVLLTVGPQARRLGAAVNPGGLPVVALARAGAPGWREDWDRGLTALAAHDFPRDRAPAPSYDGRRGQIPRADLPYGTLRWQGTSGDRAIQAQRDGEPSPDYFKLVLPAWVRTLTP